MPFLGLGLHFVVALFFAVHVVRGDRPISWLFILFMFPILGSIVYFVGVYLPEKRQGGGFRPQPVPNSFGQGSSGFCAKPSFGAFQHPSLVKPSKSLDKKQIWRMARQDFESNPTMHNRLRLARALGSLDRLDEAAEHYEVCMQGPFASDPELCISAARSREKQGRGWAARELLQRIRSEHPTFEPQKVQLMLARSFAKDELTQQADEAFGAAMEQFDSIEVKVEYAIFALDYGDLQKASVLSDEIDRITSLWTQMSYEKHVGLMQRLDKALAAAHKKKRLGAKK